MILRFSCPFAWVRRAWPALALVLLAAAAAPALRAQEGGNDPVTVTPTVGTLPAGTNVRFTFSRPVVYHVQEGRNRLILKLREPLAPESLADNELDGGILRRIRIRPTAAGGEISLYLGPRYRTYSLSEQHDPYRLILVLRGESSDDAPEPVDLDAIGSTDAPLPESGMPRVEPRRRDRSDEARPRTVVIDPGHGGGEDGAIGPSGLKEKDLVLDIARRLGERLRRAGYRAELTRDGDRSVDLTSRTAFANNLKADLFISIHANASVRSDPRGAETYFLSRRASDEDAWSLAEDENLPGAAAGEGGGSRADRDRLEMVLWEMAQTEHIARSSRLAEIIQGELNELGGGDRGVKQAPFRVLVGATMPAVLVEVGFLSNPSEELLLAGDPYRDRIAALIAGAVDRFGAEVVAASAEAGAAPRGRPSQ